VLLIGYESSPFQVTNKSHLIHSVFKKIIFFLVQLNHETVETDFVGWEKKKLWENSRRLGSIFIATVHSSKRKLMLWRWVGKWCVLVGNAGCHEHTTKTSNQQFWLGHESTINMKFSKTFIFFYFSTYSTTNTQLTHVLKKK